jgi:hypothetical protein
MKKLLPLFATAVLFACQPGRDKVAETVETQLFENQRNSFFAHMETAPSVAARLQATAAEFNGSLLHDPAAVSNYLGDSIKSAANLGVYLADLNYCVAYQEREVAGGLFNSAIALSKLVGIDQNVLEFLMIRYNDNISNQDSIADVINALYISSTSGLRVQSREPLLGVAMAAYQIETLHLALGVIEGYPKDILPDDSRIQILVPVFKFVLEQQEKVEIIHAFIRTLYDPSNPGKTPNFAYYDQAFSELIDVYKRLDVQEKVAGNRGAELLSDAVVAELSAKVNAIRSKIVSVEL